MLKDCESNFEPPKVATNETSTLH